MIKFYKINKTLQHKQSGNLKQNKAGNELKK